MQWALLRRRVYDSSTATEQLSSSSSRLSAGVGLKQGPTERVIAENACAAVYRLPQSQLQAASRKQAQYKRKTMHALSAWVGRGAVAGVVGVDRAFWLLVGVLVLVRIGRSVHCVCVYVVVRECRAEAEHVRSSAACM
jgi:hypothetical protein